MRFLDWLFKRGKKEEEKKEGAAATEAVERMSLSEAKKFLEKEKEAVFAQAYPRGRQLVEETKRGLAELRRVANDFSLKQADPTRSTTRLPRK